jgi:hypothetical protein
MTQPASTPVGPCHPRPSRGRRVDPLAGPAGVAAHGASARQAYLPRSKSAQSLAVAPGGQGHSRHQQPRQGAAWCAGQLRGDVEPSPSGTCQPRGGNATRNKAALSGQPHTHRGRQARAAQRRGRLPLQRGCATTASHWFWLAPSRARKVSWRLTPPHSGQRIKDTKKIRTSP